MNRKSRRAAAAKDSRLRRVKTTPIDRNAALRLAADMINADRTVSGATLIEPDGSVTYVDAEMLRRGGRA